MPTTRISEAGLGTLRELAEEFDQPQPAVLDEALEGLRRRRFFEKFNGQFGILREDPVAWSEEEAERSLWDQTSADGSDS